MIYISKFEKKIGTFSIKMSEIDPRFFFNFKKYDLIHKANNQGYEILLHNFNISF